jgi:hypothetical protein
MIVAKINAIGRGTQIFMAGCPNLDFFKMVMGDTIEDARLNFLMAMALTFVESKADHELQAFIDDYDGNHAEPWFIYEVGHLA